MAVSSYLTAFNTQYPTSTTGTTSWSSTGARCNVCHSSGGGTDLNAYGAAWATQHNTGLSNAQAFVAVETANSDGSAANNIGEITGNAQPGWNAAGTTTTFDLFDPTFATGSASIPTTLVGLLDPAAAVNRPPVLAAIGARTVNENQLLTFTATATDPDAGQTLSFSGGGLPTGATLSSAGAFSWTPTFAQAGTYNVTITATDNGSPAASDSETFTITVGNVNRPPVLGAIGARTATVGQALTFTATATDPDANALTFSGGGLPTGATLNATTGVFTWTPTAAQTGNFPVTITVTDNGTPAASDSEAITITVGAAANRPPVLGAIGSKTVPENQLLTFTATATDPDAGQTLSFSGGGLPTGATLSPAGVFNWTPTFAQSGTYSVTITVTDSGSPAATDFETFTITVGEVNRPPVLGAIGAKTATVGQALTFTATATDPDGNALAFSATGLPAGATLNATTGVFTWTPTAAQSGNFPVTITVTDNGSPVASDSEAITITVGAAANRPPVLAPIGARTVNENQALTFTATASDPDGGTLTFSATGLPTGATLSPAGAFNWTPTFAQAGNYNVTVIVADAGGLTDSEVVTITVGNVNRPPVLTPIGAKTGSIGQALTFTATATDPDGGALTFSATGLPTGATLSTAGVFNWTPTAAGNFPVTVTVTDTGGLTDSEVVTITVGNVNRAPVLNPIGNKTVTTGSLLSFTITGSDPDSNALTFSAGTTLPGGATLNATTGVFSWTPTAAQVSATPYSVTVTATDNGTPAMTSTPVTFTITVNAPAPVNHAPTVNNPGNKTVTEGQLLSFTITGSDPDAGNTLRFSATGLPTGATLSAGGAFSWTPATGQARATPYSVTVTATDNGTPAMTSTPVTFTITVNPPVVSPPTSVRISEAKWEESKLEVEGRVTLGGAMVRIVEVGTGKSLAFVRANSTGKFEAELRLSAAPCKVKAQAAGAQSAVVTVRGACGVPSDD